MKILSFGVFTLMFIFGCSSSYLGAKLEMSLLYDSNGKTDARAGVYLYKSDSAMVYFEITDNSESAFDIENCKLNYEMFNLSDEMKMIDSSSLKPNLERDTISESIWGFFDLKLADTSCFLLHCRVKTNSGLLATSFTTSFCNTSDKAMNNYVFLDKNGGIVIDYTNLGNIIKVRANHKIADSLYVYMYNREFPIALPPFVYKKGNSFDYKPDSVFRLNVNDHISDPVKFRNRGFYQFLEDTGSREGATVFCFNKDFPEIKKTEHLFETLRYIASKKEFEKYAKIKNKKLAVDKFWLGISPNTEIAREKIKVYYNRVEDANKMFTSYHEGWKTERGMIFIVFGPPDWVFRLKDIETWVYGELGAPNSIEFDFIKVNNPFTQNDFRLVKSPKHKEKWYFAVENWRR